MEVVEKTDILIKFVHLLSGINRFIEKKKKKKKNIVALVPLSFGLHLSVQLGLRSYTFTDSIGWLLFFFVFLISYSPSPTSTMSDSEEEEKKEKKHAVVHLAAKAEHGFMEVAAMAKGVLASTQHKTQEAGYWISENIGSLMKVAGELGGKRENDEVEIFFTDIPEATWAPVTVLCDTRSHPDSVLRRLGVIEGHAVHKGILPVYYNSRSGSWLYTDTNEEVDPSEIGQRGQRALNKRYDVQPKGLIQVSGTFPEVPLDFHDKPHDSDDDDLAYLVDESARFKAGDLVRRIKTEQEKKETALDNNPSASLIDDDRLTELSARESILLFQQYLSRGVVDAANRTESCILAPGNSKISVHLANGVIAIQDKGVGGGVQTSEIRPSKTLLIGVSPWDVSLATKEVVVKPENSLNKFFTHHVVLQRSTKPDVELEAPAVSSDRIKTPLNELKEDGLKDRLAKAEEETEKLLAPLRERWAKKIRCTGFRCSHVNKKYEPIVEGHLVSDPGEVPIHRPRHCRIFIEEFKERIEGKVGDDRRAARFALDLEQTAALKSKLGSEVWKKCTRICECGWQLGPLEISKCVCGQFDFQHAQRGDQRIRYNMLKPHVPDKKYLELLSFIATPIIKKPTMQECSRFQTTLMDTLSRGFNPETDQTRLVKAPPPRRSGIPVVTILIGGGQTQKYSIIQHIHKRWPILTVEGSGGYADALSKTILKVKQIVRERDRGEAGLDDYRQFLSGIDSMTADIIVNGHVEVIRKNTKTNEFVRKIENCLKGNEILEKSWHLYSLWSSNAEVQRARYLNFNRSIVVLGILTTAVSVVQTFLLLIWSHQGNSGAPPALPQDLTPKEIAWLVLRWSVIALPIINTFVQAIANKDNAGPKWVKLHSAAEVLLSEIYKYRTRTLEYASTGKQITSDKNKKQAESGKTEFKKEGNGKEQSVVAGSREELLQQRTQELTDGLSHSEVAAVTLYQYTGPLPPRNIRRNGDDGFTELGPDQYKRVRLETKISELEVRTRKQAFSLFLSTVAVNVFSACGTLFAAVASYGLGYMQAWVALTTALATSLNRWLDFTRLEFVQKNLNISINNLNQVIVWWAGQGADADKKKNRDTLVSDTETYILGQELIWGNIIQGVNNDDGNTKETSKDKKTDPEVQEADRLREIGTKHGLELEDLTPQKLLTAIQNPEGSNGKAVADTMKKLADMGICLPKNDTTAPPPPPEQQKNTTKPEPTELIPTVQRIPIPLLRVVQHQDTREKLLKALVKDSCKKSLNRWMILHASEPHPEFYSKVSNMSTRSLYEVCKALATEHLTAYFCQIKHFEHLPAADRNRLTRDQLVPKSCLERTLYQAELFISEMRGLAHTEGVLTLDSNSLVNIIKEPGVKELFRELAPNKRLCLRQAASKLWAVSKVNVDTDTDHLAVMLLESISELIADLDVEELMQNSETRVRLWGKLSSMEKCISEGRMTLLSKEQLLSDFPGIAKKLQFISPLQIQKYMMKIMLGTPTSRTFRLKHASFDKQIKKRSDKVIFNPHHGDRELRERLVLSIALLDQVTINRMSRGLLVRKIKVSSVYDDSVDKVLSAMHENELRFFLSTIQSRLSNTYASRLVDRAADEIHSFDVRSTIPYAEAEKLVTRIREFRMSMNDGEGEQLVDVTALSAADIFKMLEYKSLQQHLELLGKDQLCELIENMMALSSRSYPLQVYSKLRGEMKELDLPQLNSVVEDWDPEFIDNLVFAVGAVNTNQIKKNTQISDEVIDKISSSIEVAEGLHDLKNAARDANMPETEIHQLLIKLLTTIELYAGDRALSISFENASISAGVSKGVSADSLYGAFASPESRLYIANMFFALDTLEIQKVYYDEFGLLKKPEEILQLFTSHNSSVATAPLTTMCEQDGSLFMQVMAQLLIELTVESPLRIFHDIASRLTMFDIRDVLTGSSNRRRLCILIYEIYLSNGEENICDQITSPGMEQAQDWLERKLSSRPIFNDPFAKVRTPPKSFKKPGLWRVHFLKIASQKGHLTDSQSQAGEYDSLVNDLRMLSELQLKVLVEEVCAYLSTTICGKVLVRYLDKLPKGQTEWGEWLILNDAIDTIRGRIKLKPAQVCRLFDNYDAQAFVSRNSESKKRAIGSIVEGAYAIKIISRMNAKRLRLDLFSYLMYFGPVGRSKFINMTKARHNKFGIL